MARAATWHTPLTCAHNRLKGHTLTEQRVLPTVGSMVACGVYTPCPGKLNRDNWDIWHRKVQYILEEQDAVEPLTTVMVEPEARNTAQHRRDQEANQAWKKKNSIARITLLSAMADDIMCKFERQKNAQAMWIALKDKFGGTFTTKLRRLTIKFDAYKLKPNNPMKQHLREMANMIKELKEAGHIFSDEQQVQAVIKSLPASWEYMKVNLTHNENIVTFNDVAKYLELEDELLEAYKTSGQAYYIEDAGTFQSRPDSKKGKKFQKKGKKAGPQP
ncbi:uncharacterized protein LOC114738591 [Neltuma alba]|uniref:uncharacterized protein LOC114738591 n=1 Tax=Neltuma alba TaxID=207710 RepID=UPI0010A52810|nr:uncharacterized protein LOC114738591 [Prosopis alba]